MFILDRYGILLQPLQFSVSYLLRYFATAVVTVFCYRIRPGFGTITAVTVICFGSHRTNTHLLFPIIRSGQDPEKTFILMHIRLYVSVNFIISCAAIAAFTAACAVGFV